MRGVPVGPLVRFLIFALVTALSTVVLVNAISNSYGGDTVSYRARFTDASQLVPGDEVRIAGVRVGSVEDVRVVERRLAEVTLVVDDTLALPASTIATVRFRNLIGQRYLDLSQGAGPPGQTLAPGATIPLEQTRPAVNLTELFNGFRPLFQALSPADVNQLSFELIQVLQGEGPAVTTLLARTASLTSTIADKDRVIGQVIDNLNAVLDTVNARDEELTRLIVTVQQLVSGLSEDRGTIGEAIDSIGELTDTTAGLLQEARPPLRDDIVQLGRLAGNLNDNSDDVEDLLTTLPGKSTELVRAGSYGSFLNFFLCDLSGTANVPGVGEVQLPELRSGAARCRAGEGENMPPPPLTPLTGGGG